MKTVGEQAKEFRLAMGWSYTRMAEEVSKNHDTPVSRQLITQLESAGDRKPHYLKALALTMQTTVDSLLAGNLTFPLERNSAVLAGDTLAEYQLPYTGKKRIPIVGTAKLGMDGFYEEMSSEIGGGDGHIEIATEDPNAYGLRVRGNSMSPAIRDGWYVLVEPNTSPTVGEYVLVKLHTGQKMVKELLYRRPDSIEIMSVNGGERMTIYNDELLDMQAVGAVVSPSKWKPD